MSGHRRISTRLFLQFCERQPGRPTPKIQALLELDLDDFRGTRRSVRRYARMWSWSRDKVAALIAAYEAHREDLSVKYRGDLGPATDPATDQATNRPAIGQGGGHDSRDNPSGFPPESATKSATDQATDPAMNRPAIGHSLEPEPEPEPSHTQNARKRAPLVDCPEELSAEQRDRIAAWAAKLDPPIERPMLGRAWEVFRNWAVGKGERKRDWEAAFRNALLRGWPLAGSGGPGGGPENAAQRRERENAEAAREALEILRKRELRRVDSRQILAAIDGGRRGDG